jgi:hypothetical protein
MSAPISASPAVGQARGRAKTMLTCFSHPLTVSFMPQASRNVLYFLYFVRKNSEAYFLFVNEVVD